jgi:hypothetical protein
VLWVFVLTLTVLAIHPVPECIACEGSRPWGRDDIAYLHASVALDVWFLAVSIAAGFCSVRKYWLVPITVVLAHLITQPLGGVPLWSLWSNEGPVILLLGCVAGAGSLFLGTLIRFMVNRLGKRVPKARFGNQLSKSDGMRRPVSGRDAVYAPKLSTCSRHR